MLKMRTNFFSGTTNDNIIHYNHVCIIKIFIEVLQTEQKWSYMETIIHTVSYYIFLLIFSLNDIEYSMWSIISYCELWST